MTQETITCCNILWDYLVHQQDIGPADFILALGSHDERVAEYAADLVLSGYAPIFIASGGYGKVTRAIWTVTESDRFADIARGRGVPEANIIVENQATNTGQNIVNVRNRLAAMDIRMTRGILVAKPYMTRRAYATAMCQWPEITWGALTFDTTLEAYCSDDAICEQTINLMVGDIQRIRLYAETGLQIPQYIPQEVWSCYETLVTQGYDKYVIRTECG